MESNKLGKRLEMKTRVIHRVITPTKRNPAQPLLSKLTLIGATFMGQSETFFKPV